MNDDLFKRIEKYNDRIRIIFKRRMTEEEAELEKEYSRVEEEGWDEEPEENLQEGEILAGELAAPEKIPSEVFFDADEEIIGGSPWGSCEGRGLYSYNSRAMSESFYRAANRYPEHLYYNVSHDNPWYFDIDGVVYSKETGLLVYFPRGRDEYIVPEDSRITGIGDLAFVGSALKRIVLSDRISWIGHYAFAQCTSLEEIILPETLEYLGRYAFAGCAVLKKADMNCKIREIPYRCFIDDLLLESVILPPDLITIDRGAFSDCVSLKSIRTAEETNDDFDVIFPSTLERIGGEAFTNCKSIRSVSLQNSHAVVEDRVFTLCSALQIFAAEGAVEYRAYCFQGCSRLKDVTFGPQTKKLGKNLFRGVYKLNTVRFSCAPGFVCAADALPDEAAYEVDTVAWLENGKLYQCVPLFKACVRNIARGEKVPENLYREMLRSLKRNRKKLYKWFLSDEDVMRLIVSENIPDCEDCLVMFDMAIRRGMMSFEPVVKYVRGYMFRYSKMQIEKASNKLQEKKEAEEKAKRLLIEEMKQQVELNRKSITFILNSLCLEELDLSVPVYFSLKKQGINTVKKLASMSEEDLMKVPGLDCNSVMEVREKFEELTGIPFPEKRENELENSSVDDLVDLKLDNDI